MQLLCEFLCEYAVELGREISQCVPDGKYLFFFSEDVLALRSMVDILVIWFFLRQLSRNAFEYLFLKICHFRKV